MIAERTSELQVFFDEHFGSRPDQPVQHQGVVADSLPDDEVIRRARTAVNGEKFARLWAGDTSEYGGDDSAADLALLSLLAFWTQDREQLDRLFRRSGLCRPKWERPDYRERTIARALERGDVYVPGTTTLNVEPNGNHAAFNALCTVERDLHAGATPSWPVLDEAALHGLAGDVVRIIGPHTESDPVAILVDFLVSFGSAVGRSPHAAVGATKHRANEYAVLTGETSRARKGTAHQEVMRLFHEADATWCDRVMGGLSSGEGLIAAVRDPTYKIGRDGVETLADAGVADKRLLALEPEFASVLRVAGRDGNTLSEQLRRGWDGDDLRTLTKNSPQVATGPHISVVGHITKDELLRELSETSQLNGWGNRHLFLVVQRSKLLPHGGCLGEHEVHALAGRLRRALDHARRRGVLCRDADANAVWEAVYPALTASRPGMFGAITARAEAHVLRLSLIYALLDDAPEIGRIHLEAALALWDYAEASARVIFGDAIGDPVADHILSALRRNGKMNQTQISELFSRNQKAGRLEQALSLLLAAGLVRTWPGESERGGRAPTWWEALE